MGFFEILLIAVVTLLVVGPERMPEAVRSVALTIGRIKRQFENARSEIEKQVGADDIRRQLHNESVLENINKIKSDLSVSDQRIDSGETSMPFFEDEYERRLYEESGCNNRIDPSDISPQNDHDSPKVSEESAEQIQTDAEKDETQTEDIQQQAQPADSTSTADLSQQNLNQNK